MMRAEALIAVLAGATDAQRTAILRALGHAECPSAPRINPATQSTDGLMSSADKRHLDGLAEQLRIELQTAIGSIDAATPGGLAAVDAKAEDAKASATEALATAQSANSVAIASASVASAAQVRSIQALDSVTLAQTAATDAQAQAAASLNASQDSATAATAAATAATAAESSAASSASTSSTAQSAAMLAADAAEAAQVAADLSSASATSAVNAATSALSAANAAQTAASSAQSTATDAQTAAAAAQSAANNALDRANHTGTQAPSTLSAGGAGSGDGLVWNGTIWVPSRAFAYADLAALEASRMGGENYNAGFGLSGAMANFEWESALAQGASNITIDRANAAPGCGGSLRVVGYRAFACTGLIGVSPDREYRIRAVVRGDVANSIVAGLYGQILFFDADRFPITTWNAAHYGGTITDLTSALNPGDTVINVASTTSWRTDDDTAYRRFKIWRDVGGGRYCYTGANGKVYEPLGYSREGTEGDSYNLGFSGTQLTLASPWAGAVVPAGSKIANAQPGIVGVYMIANEPINNTLDWQSIVSTEWFRGVTTSTSQTLRADGGKAALWPGTSYVSIGARVNYGAGAGHIGWLSMLSLESRPA